MSKNPENYSKMFFYIAQIAVVLKDCRIVLTPACEHSSFWRMRFTLNSFMASACNCSDDNVVNGEAIVSLLCSNSGCRHKTQSEAEQKKFLDNVHELFYRENLLKFYSLGSPSVSMSFCTNCSYCVPALGPAPDTTVKWYNHESCINNKN